MPVNEKRDVCVDSITVPLPFSQLGYHWVPELTELDQAPRPQVLPYSAQCFFWVVQVEEELAAMNKVERTGSGAGSSPGARDT